MLQWQLCNRRGSGQITIRLLVPTLYKVVRLTSMPRLGKILRLLHHLHLCIHAYGLLGDATFRSVVWRCVARQKDWLA